MRTAQHTFSGGATVASSVVMSGAGHDQAASPAGLPLSSSERIELELCEEKIKLGLDAAETARSALVKIHTKGLYREFGTFHDYCLKRWGFGERRGRQLIAWAEVEQDIRKHGSGAADTPAGTPALPVPANERQARALKQLPAAERGPAMQEAVAAAGEKPVTTRHVEEAVRARSPKGESVDFLVSWDTARQEGTEAAEPEFKLEVQAPSEGATRMKSIMAQAGDISQRLGALSQMVTDAGDKWAKNRVRIASWHINLVVAKYVEERAKPAQKATKQTKKKLSAAARARARWLKVRAAGRKSLKAKPVVPQRAKYDPDKFLAAQKRAAGKKPVRPNEHGVYPDAAAEKLNFHHGKMTAWIRLLELPDGAWISASGSQYEGSGVGCGASTAPLTADKTFASREDALLAGALEVIEGSKKSVGGGWHSPEQRVAADAMGRWAHRLRKDARRVKLNLGSGLL